MRCLILGLDGATFNVLDPLMRGGVMPYLEAVTRSGVRADLHSVIPPLTPPAWTSLATGRHPGAHGVLNFVQFESADSRYMKITNSRDNRSETLWSLASRQNKTAGVLNFPVMYPPLPIDGYMIPGWAPQRWIRRYSLPPGIDERLASGASVDIKDLAVDYYAEAYALKGCDDDAEEEWIATHTDRLGRWSRTLAFLIEDQPVDLTAVVFDEVDRIQHLCWRYLDPALADTLSTERDGRLKERSTAFFRTLDGTIERLVALAGPETTVLLVSDHGFGPTREIFYINTWLEKQGFLAFKPGVERDLSAKELRIPKPNDYVGMIDWSKTLAFSPAMMGNGIYIPVAGERGPEGVSPERYVEVKNGITRRLLEDCKHPVTGRPHVTKVLSREEAYPGSSSNETPDLTFFLADDSFAAVMPSEQIILPREEVLGTHRREGIFVAKGPGIREGVVIDPLSIVDVAPAVLYLLGLAIPQDLDGRLPRDIFAPGILEAKPPRMGPSTVPPHWAARSGRDGDEPGEEETEAIMKKLKDLGYTE